MRDFQAVASEAIRQIRRLPGITLIPALTTVSDSYIGFTVKDEAGTSLKIDFVNDIPYRNGEPAMHPTLGLIDSIENILTNKLSALIGRSEVKDVADLWQISRKISFSWKTAIENAMQKEACIDTLLISETLRQVSEDDFNRIRWIRKPHFMRFQEDLVFIGQDMLEETDNTIPIRHRPVMGQNTKKALDNLIGSNSKEKGKGSITNDKS